MNNLKSYTEYAVSTPTTDFVIGFDFNYGTDAVNVTVDGVPATEAGYSVIYLNSTTMRLSPAVPTGVVRLQRETDIDVPDNQFTAGAKFIASNMDENFTQIRHSQQEVRDGFGKLSDDTYEIIDTLQVVGQAAQDAADAAEQAAQTANDAAAQVNDKVSYQDLDTAIAATPHNNMLGRDVVGAHPASAILDESGKTQQEINDTIARTVQTTSDLLSIQNPKNKQVVYVESVQKKFIYDVNLVVPENGVTIIGKWEMELQDFYYATWFADSASPLDQSAALHVGYSYATSKGKPYVVDAPFNVSGTFATFADDSHKTTFPLLSNSVVTFTPRGKLKMITNGLTSYQIMTAYNISNYRVLFPNLEGDKDTHDYTTTAGTHEWGFGFVAYQSEDGYVHKLKASNCTGDPLYIGRSWGAQTNDVPKNITFFEPDLSDARRNGISVCAWDNVQIIRPVIKNIRDVEPQSGIDIEPEQSPDTYETFPLTCKGLLIDSPKIDNCVRPINFYTALTGVDIQVDITGETIASNCDFLGSFTLNNANSGRVYIEKLYALDSTVTQLYWGWSAAGTCKLEIDEIQSNREDRITQIFMYLFGEREEKFLGNSKILLNVPVRTVFAAIGNFVDYSSYIMRNLDIRNKYEMDGLPPYVLLETTPAKPITSYPTYAATWLLGKMASYIENSNAVVMNNRRHTNDLWVGDFSGTAQVNLLSYIGTFKLTFPRASTATGAEIANANVLDDTGGVKNTISTTKKDSWIIIRKTASGSEILDKSAGWVFA